eukprot:GEMP01028597.1.p1 GENE.GEMP01028597.1~~GEMP01028597.1.p1  ORF type:complete len:403 (-),score=91.31 GEMP01028597.1:944-2152(-)
MGGPRKTDSPAPNEKGKDKTSGKEQGKGQGSETTTGTGKTGGNEGGKGKGKPRKSSASEMTTGTGKTGATDKGKGKGKPRKSTGSADSARTAKTAPTEGGKVKGKRRKSTETTATTRTAKTAPTTEGTKTPMSPPSDRPRTTGGTANAAGRRNSAETAATRKTTKAETTLDPGGGAGRPPIKLLFANLAAVETVRNMLIMTEWKFEQRQVPKAELDDAYVRGFLVQTEIYGKPMVIRSGVAALRYIGRLSNMYPGNIREAAEVDETLEYIRDFVSKFAAASANAHAEPLIRDFYCPMHDKMENNITLDINGKKYPTGYLVGSRMSIADLELVNAFQYTMRREELVDVASFREAFPLILALRDEIRRNPRLKALIEEVKASALAKKASSTRTGATHATRKETM